MAGPSVRGELASKEVLAHRRREHTIVRGEETERVDRLLRILLRPLEGAEVEDLVFGDRSAHAAAVLVAAIVLLGQVIERLRFRLRVHPGVAQEGKRAAAD